MITSRFDCCDVLPVTVQNIMLELMERHGMSRENALRVVIDVSQEMKAWGFVATDRMGDP